MTAGAGQKQHTDHDRPSRTTAFRRDLLLCFGTVGVGIIGAVVYLLGSGDSDAGYVRTMLAAFLVCLALLIAVATFVRNA